MAAPLSYEPTVLALLADILPDASIVAAGKAGLRRRVSWPALARATGIGELEGGEAVLVPGARAREVLPRLGELAEFGVSAVLIAGEQPTAAGQSPADLPVIRLPADTDLRRLQAEIERYITRRRRELFALDQELHRVLVDAAIAGSELDALVETAAARAGKQVLVDRDGDVVSAPAGVPGPPAQLLVQARIATLGGGGAGVDVPGPPPCLAVGITAGKERRGTAMILGNHGPPADEDESVLMALASACAIALARVPDTPLPALEEAVTALSSGPHSGEPASWTAVAMSDSATSARQIDRALRGELAARDLRAVMALEGAIVIALVAASGRVSWDAMARSVAARLGSSNLLASVGRTHRGQAGALRSAREAMQALDHARPETLVRYEDKELTILLGESPGWLDFARHRLGPLLAEGADQRELLHTLRAYLASGRNAKAAAQALQVHRNTLLYRLRRIERALDANLDDPETLFALDLATRVIEQAGTAPDRPMTREIR